MESFVTLLLIVGASSAGGGGGGNEELSNDAGQLRLGAPRNDREASIHEIAGSFARDIFGDDQTNGDAEVTHRLPPEISGTLTKLADPSELAKEDGSSLMRQLGVTLKLTADYIKSMQDSSDLPASVQTLFDVVARRLSDVTEKLEVSAKEIEDDHRRLKSPDSSPSHSLTPRIQDDEDTTSASQRKKWKTHDQFDHLRSHPKFGHLFGIREAAIKGDHAYISRMLQSHINKPSVRQHFHGRRTTAVTRAEQCQQLVECAEKMTIYDLILLFFFDDIDFDKGEFNDGEFIRFDEAGEGIFQVASDIAAKTGTTAASSFADAQCDDLLAQFHRTKELGDGLFAWQGGAITEVCVASGSVEHLKLESIANNVTKSAADSIFEDVILCSKQLFDAKDSRFSGESDFVFLDSNDRLRLPTGINITNRDVHGRPSSVAPTDFFDFEDITADLEGQIDDRNAYDWNGDNAIKAECIDLAEEELTTAFLARSDATRRLGDTSSEITFTVDCNDPGFECCNGEDFLGSCIGAPFGVELCKFHTCEFKTGNTVLKTWSDTEQYSFNSNPFNGQPLGRGDASSNGPYACRNGCDVLVAGSPLKNTPAEQFDKALELVFGEKPSPGLLCGISSSVADTSTSTTIGGTCCLDTPAESVDNWGQPYQCGATCNRFAPYFAGISEETCDVYGGTYCLDETNCAVLQACVAQYIDDPQNENRTAYLRYLRSAPNVTEPSDAFLCGRAREYFGFEANFPNDDIICDNVDELKTTNDFTILEEFASSGSNAPGGPPTGTPARITLDDPEATKYTEDQALAWRVSNFAVAQALTTVEGIKNAIKAVKCPCDIVTTNLCKAVTNISSKTAQVIIIIIKLGLEVSAFIYGEEVGTNEQIAYEQWNNVQKIKPNMDTMLTAMYDETDDIDQTLADQFCTVDSSEKSDPDFVYGAISTCNLYHEVLCRPAENLKPGHGCDGVDNDCDYGNVVDECDEDAFPPEIGFSSVQEFCGGDKHVFGSADEARACVEAHVEATDDCEVVNTTVPGPVASASNDLSLCGTMYKVVVTATEDICAKSASSSFFVLVDDNIPGGCEFTKGPDFPPTLDISMATDLCGGKVFFQSLAEAEDCVDSNSKASDDCRDVEISLTPVNITGSDDALSSCTATYAITVTATVKGCPSVNTTDVVHVLVDDNVPPPSCNFDQGPDVPPRLDMAESFALCSGKIFPTAEDAEACVLDASVAVDAAGGCRPIEKIVESGQVNNCEYEVNVTANIKDCQDDALKTTSVPIKVVIDNEAPVPSCEHSVGTTIDISGSGVLEDVGLAYTVTENCGGPLSVTVESFSNELEDVNSQKMALLYQSPGATQSKVGLFVATTICSSDSNGQCITDPNEKGRRFYATRITATDEAGLKNSTECFVEVVANGNMPPNTAEAPGSSKQLFLLDSFVTKEYEPDDMEGLFL